MLIPWITGTNLRTVYTHVDNYVSYRVKTVIHIITAPITIITIIFIKKINI